MPLLLPFRALRYRQQPAPVFIPGEGPPAHIDPADLIEDDLPSLFIYEQRFRYPGDLEDSVRCGVTGLLNRAEATVFPHEQIFPARVDACRHEAIESSSIFLWCRDESQNLAPLLRTTGPADLTSTDRFACTHNIWRVEDPHRIETMQAALGDQPLFIADGHHRYAGGWNLATVEVRTPALRSLAAHRLVFEDIDVPNSEPITDLRTYCASTQRGHVRFGVVKRGEPLMGIELPHAKSERNVAVLHRLLLKGVPVQPVRTIERAIEAVEAGEAKMAFLLEPLPVDKIETDASKGILLPAKSTDFYPKLAGGLIMHRHQNDSVTPPVAQIPGVRNPSS